MAIENEWKPADIFSTLGEREHDRSLLEARRVQWKQELDEQVALKKKEKEASQKWNDPWKKSEIECEKLHTLNQSKGEEHDRWAVHLDSLKSHAGSQSQLSCQRTHQPLESCCVSPDTQELADVHSVYTPSLAIQLEPSEEQRAKPVTDMTVSYSQKTNFLHSMTVLLDPAQTEEREKRRHKQLEHQKAIMAQVEENRRKKQQEEGQRKKEEQEEEQRLALEQEEMQRHTKRTF
ncbi:Coiled-coil domain-containing protein 66 [Microtus ochrogaster]|uniref:Coiled-coil domain-containing protein 66 n=1 Tax=Microtus ochrogaster TaxID=79684 RepID=A0A8J6GPK6_MICOH|nr:Coiled-coil domain-containing protein 66 [Microtus ochrogaster]